MPPSNAESIADQLDLGQFFDEARISYDLRGGVIFNAAKTRLCLFPADLLAGIHKSLVQEAGPAWSLILKNCGRIWGERVARRLDRECQKFGALLPGEMPLDHYLKFIATYFSFHGWGLLDLDLSHVTRTGIIEAGLRNSLFAEVLTDIGQDHMADPMVSGLLSALFSHISQARLDCVQTACSTRGAPASLFLITSAPRLQAADDLIRQGQTHAQLIELI